MSTLSKTPTYSVQPLCSSKCSAPSATMFFLIILSVSPSKLQVCVLSTGWCIALQFQNKQGTAEGGRLSTYIYHFYFLKPHQDDLKSNGLLNAPSFLLKSINSRKKLQYFESHASEKRGDSSFRSTEKVESSAETHGSTEQANLLCKKKKNVKEAGV